MIWMFLPLPCALVKSLLSFLSLFVESCISCGTCSETILPCDSSAVIPLSAASSVLSTKDQKQAYMPLALARVHDVSSIRLALMCVRQLFGS